MKGKVKWFSTEKGYGFIVGADGVEYFFSVSDIKGADLPNNGDSVEFTETQTAKGARAKAVTIAARLAAAPNTTTHYSDNRVRCRSCGKAMIPRIVTGPPLGATRHWTPVPKHSICPVCAKIHETFEPSDGEIWMDSLQWIGRICAGIILLWFMFFR
jgi:cold shock CspA family protein/rubredoxin